MWRASCLLLLTALWGCHWLLPFSPGPAHVDGAPDLARDTGRYEGRSAEGRPAEARPPGKVYYVSPGGNGQGAASWSTAWSELDRIEWTKLQAGDVVLVDGGTGAGIVYRTSLFIDGVNGAPDLPIVIRRADEPNHDGPITISGGRSVPLPDCNQLSYSPPPDSAIRLLGIEIKASSWIVVDGGRWRGITIRGHRDVGADISAAARHVTLRNVEVLDNGRAVGSAGAWTLYGEGIRVAGTSIAIERALLHDNAQEPIQAGAFQSLTIRESWLFSERTWNGCSETVGLNSWVDSTHPSLLVDLCVIGPGLRDGIAVSGTVNDGIIKGSLIYGTGDFGHNVRVTGPGSQWTLDQVTSDRPELKWHNLSLGTLGGGTTVTINNSIFTGSDIYIPGPGDYSGNCQFGVVGNPTVGEIKDPLYAGGAAVYGSLATSADYALLPTSPCLGRGALVTSGAALLAR